jgi:hypothetical protein
MLPRQRNRLLRWTQPYFKSQDRFFTMQNTPLCMQNVPPEYVVGPENLWLPLPTPMF